jgi:AraC-like DNA-binding protein
MARPTQKPSDQPDWIVMAEPYDHHLDASSPFQVFAGAGPPMPFQVHLHRAMDVGVMLAGVAELQFGDVAITAQPGDVWLCSSWEPHAWRMPPPGVNDVLFIFLPEVLEEGICHGLSLLDMFTVLPSRRPSVRTPEMRAKVLDIAWEVHEEVLAEKPGWETMARAALIRLLVTLKREWDPPARLGVPDGINANILARIAPAVALANSDLTRRIESREAAAECGLSASRFNEVFRQAMGLSYGEFRSRARLTYAAIRLLSTDLPIKTIATGAGFVDGSHLHHKFVPHFGCTPAEYRKRGQLTPGAQVRARAASSRVGSRRPPR